MQLGAFRHPDITMIELKRSHWQLLPIIDGVFSLLGDLDLPQGFETGLRIN